MILASHEVRLFSKYVKSKASNPEKKEYQTFCDILICDLHKKSLMVSIWSKLYEYESWEGNKEYLRIFAVSIEKILE